MPAVSAEEIKAAAALWDADPAASVAELKRLLQRAGEETASVLPVLEKLIPIKEWHERIKHGQQPYHVASLEELYFHYAKAELAEYVRLTEKAITGPSATVEWVMHRCMALFAIQQFAAMDHLLSQINPLLGRHVWTNVTFKGAFYEGLERMPEAEIVVGSSRVDLQACKLEYSIVSPK